MDNMPDFVNQFALVDFLSYFIPGIFFVGYEYWLLDDSCRLLLSGPIDTLFPENALVLALSFVACGYIAGMLLGMLGGTVWEPFYSQVSKSPDSKEKSPKIVLRDFTSVHGEFLLKLTLCGGVFYPATRLFSVVWKCSWKGIEFDWKMIPLGVLASVLFFVIVLRMARKGLRINVNKLKKTKEQEKERKMKLYQSFHLMFRDLAAATVILLFQSCCGEITVLKEANLEKTFAVVLYCLLVLFVSRGMQYRSYYEGYLNAIGTNGTAKEE